MIIIGYGDRMAELPENWNPLESLGDTGIAVAKNIRYLRERRGLAYTELTARLEQLGRSIPTLGLRKIESGGRRVDTDDLVALALALGVSPATLLMPEVETVTPDDIVGAITYESVAALNFWEWLTATRPLPQTRMTQMMFGAQAWPLWIQERAQQDGRQKLTTLLAKEDRDDGNDQ